MQKKLWWVLELVLITLLLYACDTTQEYIPNSTVTETLVSSTQIIVTGTAIPEIIATKFLPTETSIPPTQTATTVPTATSTPFVWPVNRSIDIVEFQQFRQGDWFTENIFSIPEFVGNSEVSFDITDIPIENRRNGEISPSLFSGYLYLQWDISAADFDKYDHTIKTLFIRSSLMSFVDYLNNRVIIPWTLQSSNIPTDVLNIVELCNEKEIPIFLEINYSDYIPGQVGSEIDDLEETDTTSNLISYIKSLHSEGIHIDGVTFGDEWEDEAGYGEVKPTIHNSDFVGRYIDFAKALKSEFPHIKIYAFDSYIMAARGQVSKYRSHLARIRQAELEENMNLIDGFIYRESYVYIDKNGELLDSQLILDDTESLYRDTPVYRYDTDGDTFPNPDRNYLNTVIDLTTEIFNRSLNIGITEYLPAGPYKISEIDTSRYSDIDFIIHYSDIIGIYAEHGLDIVSKIMFGDAIDMHKAYFDRYGNLGVNYPVYEQINEYFSGQVIQVSRSIDYDDLKVKVYVTRMNDNYFIMILNKDVSNEHIIEINLPDRFDITIRLPQRSYTSLIVDKKGIKVSGIGK